MLLLTTSAVVDIGALAIGTSWFRLATLTFIRFDIPLAEVDSSEVFASLFDDVVTHRRFYKRVSKILLTRSQSAGTSAASVSAHHDVLFEVDLDLTRAFGDG